MKKPPAEARYPPLDGLRGLAILLVVTYHYWQGYWQSVFIQNSISGRFAFWGQTGVDLFFVLSGFLITGIVLDFKSTPGFFKNFYARRILRIFPLYYLTLTALYGIAPLLRWIPWAPLSKTAWFWACLYNLPFAFNKDLTFGPSHFWSLAVEWQYYLFWPLLVTRLTDRSLLRIIGAVLGLSPLLRSVMHAHGYNVYVFTFCRLDGLALGSAIALYLRSPGGLSQWVPSSWLGLPALALILVLSQWATGLGSPFMQATRYSLVSLFYAAAMVLALEKRLGRTADRLLSGRFMGLLGKHSYAMYVVHPFIVPHLVAVGVPYHPAGLALLLAISYTAAVLLWTLVERPCLGLKRYFEFEFAPVQLPKTLVADSSNI